MTDLSPLMEARGPIAIACHDAGAANVLLGWLAQSGRVKDCLPAMAGPARAAWRRAFPDGPESMPPEAAMAGAATVITGTGWQTDFEHAARVAARDASVCSIAVIDHWSNYRERFVRGGELVLPDRIWVADEHAHARVMAEIPEVPVTRLPPSYLDREAGAIGPVPDTGGHLLYVLEPARDAWGRGTPGEFQALDYLIANLAAAGIPPATPIRLRPHPSDEEGKYDEWLARQGGIDARLDDEGSSLADAIGRARWVAGCQSFAMVVALAAKRGVICTLPPWAPDCILPQRRLVHLKDLVARP